MRLTHYTTHERVPPMRRGVVYCVSFKLEFPIENLWKTLACDFTVLLSAWALGSGQSLFSDQIVCRCSAYRL